jgi:cell wall-associated NlpC family hydrolase
MIASRFGDDRVTMHSKRTASAAAPHRRFAAICALAALFALPCAVLAAPAKDNAASNPPAETAAPASTARAARPVALTLPDRALVLASDLNRLLKPDAAAEAGAKPEGRVRDVLQRALGLLGTPYRWGGSSPDSGFDCSGLVGYVFRNALGIELPRVSREMAKAGEPVADRASLSAGDLVFFSRTGGEVDHVGIYVGEGRFVHAPRTGRDVTVSSLDTGYWSEKFLEARRVHEG